MVNIRDTADVLGVPIDRVTMEEAVSRVHDFISEGGVHSIFTPNAEIIMQAQRDERLQEMLSRSDMLIADGAGVILASRILGLGLPEKVSGVDLSKRLFAAAVEKKYKFFFFGGKPGVAETAAQRMQHAFPGLTVSGCRNGYFSEAEEDGIIDMINSSNADILLVAFGVPLQERWIDRNKSRLKVKVCMGIGGGLDIFAGTVKLAPEFMRSAGLEWLFRLCREPWRYKRMLDLPRFVLRILKLKLTGK